MRGHHLDSFRRAVPWLSVLFVLAGSAPGADGFRRGDANESGGLEVTDAIRILRFLFLGEADGIRCRDAADADDQGGLDITDAMYLLASLFLGGPPPAAPFPTCGSDPTADALDCSGYEPCDTPIRFFGFDYQASGLFFVIDRSGTFQDSGELARAKEEVIATVSSLAEDFEFAVLFSDRGLITWPVDGKPARATPENKASGIAFVKSVSGGSGSCDALALESAVGFAALSAAREKSIFYVSDGLGTCMGGAEETYLRAAIDSITAANNGLARIHSIQLNGTERGEVYMRELAEKNGGTFHQLDL